MGVDDVVVVFDVLGVVVVLGDWCYVVFGLFFGYVGFDCDCVVGYVYVDVVLGYYLFDYLVVFRRYVVYGFLGFGYLCLVCWVELRGLFEFL